MSIGKSILKWQYHMVALIFITAGLSFFEAKNTMANDKNSGIDKWNVLEEDCRYLLYTYQLDIAQKQLDNRREIISEAYQNPEKIKEYQTYIKSQLDDIILTFPEKTPLNAKTTGVIEFEDYRIENIVFESRPNLYITGNLYIPQQGEWPFPAVLETCGHSKNGKAAEKYQSAAILLAKHGFVTLVIDTYSQGERESDNHTQIDIGAMLVGTDLVAYQAWDNIRAIDYLCSLPYVNQEKIGVTGNSGGGTQTMYMMAFDPRVKAVAVSQGLQTRERMFSWRGLADGCHNFANEGMKMLEYADYFIQFAPKPAIVLAGERDAFFDINAVSNTVREAKWFYKELGFVDRLDLFTVDEGHGFQKGLREAAVWWFKKWLLDDTGRVKEPELTIQPDEKLTVTNTGQVLTEFKNSIPNANIQLANDFADQRRNFWKNNPKQNCIAKVKELINYQDKTERNEIKHKVVGEIKEKGVTIRKLHITARDGFPVPALMYIPDEPKSDLPATIYLNDHGKFKAFDTDSALNAVFESGRIVLAIDVRGFGETFVDLRGFGNEDVGAQRKGHHDWNDQHQISQTAIYIGYPLMGQRVKDVIDALDHLLSYPEVKKSDIEIVGIGNCGLVALHTAAINSRFSSVKIINSISSFMDIISQPKAKNQFKNVVPGAMQYYDLPDLVNSIKPGRIEIIDPVDAHGNLAIQIKH